MQTTQYWKPGEKKPRDEGNGPQHPSGNNTSSSSSTAGTGTGDRDRGRRGDQAEGRSNSSNGKRSGSAKKRGKKSKDNVTERTGGIDAEVSRAAAKPPVAGPSQGLLAMKFMQRKVKADEAQKQQQAKRDKLERDFSSSYAKRLKADKANDKDRLICRQDEQDPALVVVGRRSFGGFNVVAEAAYDACIRDIAAGERIGQLGREDAGGGISDEEMAETLGKNVRGGGRR